MGLDEALYSPGFYLLAGGGIIALLMGWKLSQSWGTATFPLWQLVVIMVVIIIASAFFATRE